MNSLFPVRMLRVSGITHKTTFKALWLPISAKLISPRYYHFVHNKTRSQCFVNLSLAFRLIYMVADCCGLPFGITFHWSTSVFLVPLAFLGVLGGSGSQLKVVKLTASDGFPCKRLHMAWTLRKAEQSGDNRSHRALNTGVQTEASSR